MKLILDEDEYLAYESISRGECPGNCTDCLIYRLGLPCDGEDYDIMLKMFRDAGNDEGIEIEVDYSQY